MSLRDAIAKIDYERRSLGIPKPTPWEEVVSRGLTAPFLDNADAILAVFRSYYSGHPERVSALLADRERTDATCGDAWEDSPRGDARQVFWDYLRERKVKIHNINIVNDALHRVAEVVAAAALSKVG